MKVVDLDRIEAEILARLNGRGRLHDFIRRVAPHEPPPRHLQPLIEVMERARHQRVKVLLSMPPGHAKTLTILRANAWWLEGTPADTNAYLSYSDQQAWSKSKIARSICEDAGLKLDNEFAAGAEWRTAKGGGMLASGVGGRLTGNRVTGFAVVDDPFKSRVDADSRAAREEVWSWFNTVVRTRLQAASLMVVHTRWHPDDLIGRLEKQGGWEVINLSALAEDNDPLGRAPGEALWPEMYPAPELIELKRVLGEFDFAALYQGQPRPRGAKVFKDPARFDLRTFDPTGCTFVIGVDPAASKKTMADYSVAVLMAVRKRPGKLPLFYVVKVMRMQATIPTFAKHLRAFQLANGSPTAYIEAVAGFKAVPQIMTEIEGSLLVEESPVHGDKFQRSQPMAAAWNDDIEQRVLVPFDGIGWQGVTVEEFISEHKEFTGAEDGQDDQVDAAANSFNALISRPEPVVFSRPSMPLMPRRR